MEHLVHVHLPTQESLDCLRATQLCNGLGHQNYLVRFRYFYFSCFSHRCD